MSDTIIVQPVVQDVTVQTVEQTVTAEQTTQQVTVQTVEQTVTVQPTVQQFTVQTGGGGGGGGDNALHLVAVLTNGDMVDHTPGQAVYFSGTDTVKLAIATSMDTANVVALAAATVAAGATGLYQIAGILPDLSGLTTDTTYFLSDTVAGRITASAPTAVGRALTEIGIACSPTQIMVRPRRLIQL